MKFLKSMLNCVQFSNQSDMYKTTMIRDLEKISNII